MNAYLDNMIEVQLLLEESDTKTVALERVADLEDELSYVGIVDFEIPSGCYVRDMYPRLNKSRVWSDRSWNSVS